MCRAPFFIVAVIEGEALTAEKMEELEDATLKKIEKGQKELEEEIRKTMRQAQELQKEAKNKM
ncbi:hypothetical protein ACFL0B_10010, partial [Thermodesulfobacteriota bacterium]